MNARLSGVLGCFLCAHLNCVLGASALTSLRPFGFADYSAANPAAELIEASDGALYGTTSAGGSAGKGTVFRMERDGTGFRVLKSFGATTNEGARPFAALIEASDTALYGTTAEGGDFGYGTVFRLAKDGGGFTVLQSFAGGDGAYPEARLLEASDGLLYGTASGGGTNDYGVVFRISKDGSGFSALKKFTGTDGSNPEGGLIEAGDGVLYGTTYSGGSNNIGTVFRLSKDGGSFAVLKGFTYTGSGGYRPQCRLVEGTNGTLYGTTSAGGTNGTGILYALNKDGTGFSVLRHFAAYTTSDGRTPLCEMIRASDGLLYGTTYDGGTNGSGTVFRIGQDGSNYTVLASLVTAQGPAAALLETADGALYGTTQLGGDSGDGAIFKLQKDGTGFSVVRSLLATGGDGGSPYAGLTAGSDGALYGTTRLGGQSGAGTLFALRPDGRDYRLVGRLTGGTNASSPVSPLLEGTNGILYGGTLAGGTGNVGTVFSLEKSGANFAVLQSLTAGTTGQEVRAGLLQASDGLLYGVTTVGGSSRQGTIFRLASDGSGFTVLRQFTGGTADGANPMQALLEASDHQLYGATYSGGASNSGTIFKLGKDGAGYQRIKSFGDPVTDGANPLSPLLEASDGALYGTTYSGGGSNNAGAVFRLNKDGTAFQMLHGFTGTGGDARHPCGKLAAGSDGALYGATEGGGSSDWGTLFKLNKDGSGFAILASFDETTGRYPRGGVVAGPEGALYGTADQGGAMDFGTVFRYGLPLESIRQLAFAGGLVSLACAGFSGTNYWIERAPQLDPAAVWTPLYQTNAPMEGRFEVLDPSPPAGAGFYRMKR